jgi:carbon storage regulator
MLILSREVDESVVIGGLNGITPMIKVMIVRAGDRVRLGIEAPADVTVHRLEVWERIQAENRRAKSAAKSRAPAVHLAPVTALSRPVGDREQRRQRPAAAIRHRKASCNS